MGTACTPAPWPGSALRPEPSPDSLLPPPRAPGAVLMAPGKKAREHVGSVDHRGAPADCVYLSGLRRGCVCGGGHQLRQEGAGVRSALQCALLTVGGAGGGRPGWRAPPRTELGRSRLSSSSPQAGRPPWREHLTGRRRRSPKAKQEWDFSCQESTCPQLSSEAAAWPRGYQRTF